MANATTEARANFLIRQSKGLTVFTSCSL